MSGILAFEDNAVTSQDLTTHDVAQSAQEPRIGGCGARVAVLAAASRSEYTDVVDCDATTRMP